MKKLVALIFSLILICCSNALAEAINVSEYTTDELIEIRNAVNDELYNRMYSEGGEPFYSGTYIVGQDIKPGNYLLTYVKQLNNYSVSVRMYGDMEAYQKARAERVYGDLVVFIELDEGDSTVLNLSEGNVLIINDSGVFTLESYSASWQP